MFIGMTERTVKAQRRDLGMDFLRLVLGFVEPRNDFLILNRQTVSDILVTMEASDIMIRDMILMDKSLLIETRYLFRLIVASKAPILLCFAFSFDHIKMAILTAQTLLGDEILVIVIHVP